MIVIKTSLGEIKLELYKDEAPNTVKNFLEYVNSGFYNKTIFHRVIKGFMCQGGGFEANLVHKTADKVVDNEADNGLSNLTGTVAMARTMDPHSASSQFFINVNDNKFLDHKNKNPDGWGYCVFAKVVDGLDVVTKMSNVETSRLHGHDDVPVVDILIEEISEIN